MAANSSSGSGNSSQSPTSPLVDPNTYGSAGFVVGIAALAIIIELLFIIVRICNIGLINLKVKIFLIIVSINSQHGQVNLNISYYCSQHSSVDRSVNSFAPLSSVRNSIGLAIH